jgi:hypothetical protein
MDMLEYQRDTCINGSKRDMERWQKGLYNTKLQSLSLMCITEERQVDCLGGRVASNRMQVFKESSALSLAGLVLILGIERSLGDEGVALGGLTLGSSLGLHLGVDVLGAGVLLVRVRGGIDLGGGGGLFGGGGSVTLGLVVVVFQFGTVDIGVFTEAILHGPGRLLVNKHHRQIYQHNILELLNAVNALGLLLGVDEAAERSLEVLSAWPVGHATEARAVPVDLASLRVECGLLASLFLKLLGVQTTFQSGGLGRLRGGAFLTDLGSNGVEGLGGGIIAILLFGREERD